MTIAYGVGDGAQLDQSYRLHVKVSGCDIGAVSINA